MRKLKILSKLLPQDFEDYIKEIDSDYVDSAAKSAALESLAFVSNLMVDLKADKLSISGIKNAFKVTNAKKNKIANDNDTKSDDCQDSKINSASDSKSENEENKIKPKRRRSGGKISFDDYKNIDSEDVKHETLSKGDICPDCGMGKLYIGPDGKAICFDGNAALQISKYRIECFRCNSCGGSFKAKFNKPKWSHAARSTCILNKINGMPFYRMSKMQNMYGIPVHYSTIWIQCLNMWNEVGFAIFDELCEEIKKSQNIYTDDTGAKILEFHGSEKACHTTIVCGQRSSGEDLLLYLTKNGYCGENIADLITGCKNFMSDASTMNNPHIEPKKLAKIVRFNCLYHGRIKFKEIEESYPKECGYFLEQIKNIYDVDRQTKDMSSDMRLNLHQKLSEKYVNNIYAKIDELFDSRIIEPNSRLGTAMNYWRNHKEGLTRFLKEGGMSLDNNISERNLKSIILQRNNSLFSATGKSAGILSGLSSIAFTCYVNEISAFSYFNWIQDNSSEVIKDASSFMPWKYMDIMNATERIAA